MAHPAWANSCSSGAGKVSRGDEETDTPLPMCSIWFFLFFPRAACPPPSFPSCPVGRSTAAKCSFSLLGGIPSVVVVLLLLPAQHHPPHSLESRSHKSWFVPGKELSLKRRTRRIVCLIICWGFFKLFFPFCSLDWHTQLLISHSGILEGY